MKLEARTKRVAVFLMIIMCCTQLGACSKTDTTTDKPNAEPTVASVASPEPTSKEPSAESTKNGSMTIKYVGNSCFYLKFPDGTTLLTDPYPAKLEAFFGPAPDMEVDAYTVSHYHEDHTPSMRQLKGEPLTIIPSMMKEPFKVGDVEVTGFPSKHVSTLGENEIFVFRYGDLKIVHMGETDKIESPEALEAVKDADVVLTYTGEYSPETLDNSDIFQYLYDLNVKVLIPQHFSNKPEAIFYGEPTMDEILKEVPQGVETVKLSELVVTKDMKKQFVALSQMNAK